MDKNSQIKSAFTVLFHSGLFEWKNNCNQALYRCSSKSLKNPLRSQAGAKLVKKISSRSGPVVVVYLPQCPNAYQVPPSTVGQHPVQSFPPHSACPWCVCTALGFWGTQFFFGWIYAEPFWNCLKVILCAKWRPNVKKYILVGREKMWGTNLVCELSSRVETPPQGLFGKGNYLFSFLKMETV